MGGKRGTLVGILLAVAACSTSSTPRDPEGSPAAPDGAATASPEGGAVVPNSSTGLGNFHGVDGDEGGLVDAGIEGGGPTRIGGDAPWPTAVPAGMPQVTNHGGPRVTAPLFQAVTFANYDMTSEVEDFVAKIGSSAYWPEAVAEYGIGPAAAAPPVRIASNGPGNIDDTAIQTWLASELTSPTSGTSFASPTAGAIYVIFYPAATNVTFDGQQSCFTMGAYHNSLVVGGANVPYVVVPECAWPSRTVSQVTTSAASHEMIEAATDPLPLSLTPAYQGVDPGHLYFQILLGGEIADLCAQWPASFFVPEDLAYQVQRVWSNSAVSAGRDPCQPELPGETFFNAVPTLLDTVQISDGTQLQATLGARIAPGASRVVDVNLYSEADVGPWTVQVSNIPVASSNLGFAWDRTTGNSGDTLHLTITVNAVDPTYGGEPFLLESTLDGVANYWLGYVGQ